MTTLILGGTSRSGTRILDRPAVASVPVGSASRRTGLDWNERAAWGDAVHLLTFARASAGGVPAQEAGPPVRLFTDLLDGRNASLTDGIEQLPGRPASALRAYARRAAGSGAWS